MNIEFLYLLKSIGEILITFQDNRHPKFQLVSVPISFKLYIFGINYIILIDRNLKNQ